MVYDGKSHWNGWFRGTPILGNHHLIPYTHICMYLYCIDPPLPCWIDLTLGWHTSQRVDFSQVMKSQRWKRAAKQHMFTNFSPIGHSINSVVLSPLLPTHILKLPKCTMHQRKAALSCSNYAASLFTHEIHLIFAIWGFPEMGVPLNHAF